MPILIPSLEQIAVCLNSPIIEGPPDAIPGLLPRRGQLVIAGETDIGKSLVALEICSALITNTPLWGELHPTFQARRIIYVLGEHYNEVIQRLWQLTNLPMTDQVWIIGPEKLGMDKWLVMQGRPNFAAIEKFKSWAAGADLIVFDPLSAFLTGVDGENDNLQMRLVLDTMSIITQHTGASCLILAHQGKPTLGPNGKEYTRQSYAIRGASAIEDAATNIFYLGRYEGSSATAQKVAHNCELFSLKRRKYKGLAPESYTLLRHPTTKVHTLLGDRPAVDAYKDLICAKVSKLQGAYPEMPFPDVIKGIAAIEGIAETTVRRYVGLKIEHESA